jgi:hypothetical protein
MSPASTFYLAASVAGVGEEAVVLLELVANAELGRKPWQAAMAGPGAWAVFQHPPRPGSALQGQVGGQALRSPWPAFAGAQKKNFTPASIPF